MNQEANGGPGRIALWTVTDLVERLKVSPSWVYSNAANGTLPSVKIGGLLRFIPEEIEAFVKGIEIPPRNIISLPAPRRR